MNPMIGGHRLAASQAPQGETPQVGVSKDKITKEVVQEALSQKDLFGFENIQPSHSATKSLSAALSSTTAKIASWLPNGSPLQHLFKGEFSIAKERYIENANRLVGKGSQTNTLKTEAQPPAEGSVKDLKEAMESLQPFKPGGFELVNRLKGIKSSFYALMDSVGTKTSEGALIEKRGATKSADTWTLKEGPIKKNVKLNDVKIDKNSLNHQVDNTQVRVVKDKVDESYVKNAAAKGLDKTETDAEREEKMLWRLASSPVFFHTDMTVTAKFDKPVEVQAYVGSAREYGNEHIDTTGEKAKLKEGLGERASEEIRDQTNMYFDAAIEDGCSCIVDSGFGMGAFAMRLRNGEDEGALNELQDIFVKQWTDAAIDKIKENPKLVIVMSQGGALGSKLEKAIKEKTGETPDLQDRLFVSNKMSADIAIAAKREGNFGKVAVRVAGDKAGIAGMHFLDNDGGINQAAQEETLAGQSTLGLMNAVIASGRAKFKEV
jgi:hypothetical protein